MNWNILLSQVHADGYFLLWWHSSSLKCQLYLGSSAIRAGYSWEWQHELFIVPSNTVTRLEEHMGNVVKHTSVGIWCFQMTRLCCNEQIHLFIMALLGGKVRWKPVTGSMGAIFCPGLFCKPFLHFLFARRQAASLMCYHDDVLWNMEPSVHEQNPLKLSKNKSFLP